MKAIIDTKTNKATLDSEAIKAIRFVYGLPTDLRVKCTEVNKAMLWHWIHENFLGIFGMDYVKYTTIHAMDDEWDIVEKLIDNVVFQILGC